VVPSPRSQGSSGSPGRWREVGGDGITVNVIAPGLTVTKAVRDHFPEEILRAQRDRRALQHDEQPEDLAALGQGKIRNDKLPALAEALSGMRFGPQHAHAAASLLRAIDLLDAELADLQERVAADLAAILASWGVERTALPGRGRAGRRCRRAAGRRAAG
jgi:NAD(P)-dependent dehydrogenase (short-subunit alcohol dehydrogenase family)